jgi:hypothetical protein
MGADAGADAGAWAIAATGISKQSKQSMTEIFIFRILHKPID